MDKLTKAFRDFTEERDWDQFHTPENLAKSICIEAGELLECQDRHPRKRYPGDDSRHHREGFLLLCLGYGYKNRRSPDDYPGERPYH